MAGCQRPQRHAPRRLSVYILIDALGWPVVSEHGFLEALLPVRQPLRTTLGYSSGAIPTILTGCTPSQHGRWNLLYFDPDHSPFRWLRWGGPLACGLDHRYGRALLTRVGRHLMGLGPGFECVVAPRLLPWFSWAERRHLYAPGGMEGCTTAFDHWRRAGLRYRVYSHRDGTDAELLRRAQRAIEDEPVEALFIYLCELDHFLHQHRPDPAAIGVQLSVYSNSIAALYAAAARRDSALSFRIFSDHGMAPVRARLDLTSGLQLLPWRMPNDYLVVRDSTMLRFWFFNARARREIEAWLREMPDGRLLEDAELRSLGVWFADRRYGERIFLLDPGVIIAEGEFNGRGWNPSGMHGYHPDDPDSDAVLLSNQPIDRGAHEIRDLFGCLMETVNAAVEPEAI